MDGDLVVCVDDQKLDVGAFLWLIRPFCGWGMRITFTDESQIHGDPEVTLREPEDQG
ncbi:DUF7713 domain-containing protein [Roseinatronobacter bogoriensis]|uniref:DUF7713 domain-containing protein n=1 Tax=Roseinatronobacter bogoriensis TaxID=119542 RepID=UPI0012FE5809|nr:MULTISPECIES: hypothetical protein [Rhodobaca]MBB4209223.1 hypothetical protein [Rhodobaca bogoriensis DSM 18756]